MTETIYYYNPVKQEIADLATIRGYNPNASIPAGGDKSVLGWFPLREEDHPKYDELTQVLSWTVEAKQSINGPYFYRSYKVSNLPEDTVKENLQAFVEKQKGVFLQTAQKKLDDFAKAKGYDDIKSAVGYTQSTISRFKEEAQVCLRKRDEMWSSLFVVLDKIEKGEIPIPREFSEIEQYLPSLIWS